MATPSSITSNIAAITSTNAASTDRRPRARPESYRVISWPCPEVRRLPIGLGVVAGLLATVACAADHAQLPPLPAFPGAIGFGQTAIGWRGGAVIKVTNTEDSGPGSLRHCLEGLDKPRVCIVETSGTIALDRDILVRPNVYLAGQTAPGGGLQLR